MSPGAQGSGFLQQEAIRLSVAWARAILRSAVRERRRRCLGRRETPLSSPSPVKTRQAPPTRLA
jgi:hypothetical protein